MGPSSELLRPSVHCLKTISLSKRIYFLYPKLSDNNLKQGIATIGNLNGLDKVALKSSSIGTLTLRWNKA